MKKFIYGFTLIFIALFLSCNKDNDPTLTTPTTINTAYNELWIPPTITGTTFNLTLAKSTKQLRTGAVTDTYGYNGASFWGPTLIMNKGDNVQTVSYTHLTLPTNREV